uniref:NR LBD domain-containing protein n=1 Tax=Tetranychus urticae TaxID=32264 RepID=T1KHQ8_TETUR
MDFDNDFQLVNPVQNEALFSGNKSIDVETSAHFPALSLATIESMFTSDSPQTPVNQQSNKLEDFSHKKDRLLENGQIKLLTQAIDSYYNSTLDPPPCNSSSMSISTDTHSHSNRLNDNVATTSTSQYLNLLENQVTGIRNKDSAKNQTKDWRNIWNSDTGKKILAVEFSPMNIKSEFLSTQTMLDGFESFAIQEAVYSVHRIVQHIVEKGTSEDILNQYRADLYADPRPVDLVLSCEKSRAFRKLHLNDKIILLKNAFLDLRALKEVTAYNASINEKILKRSPDLFKKIVRLMDSFPDRFRIDINVCSLLFLIIIFNADLHKLKFRNQIKSEQYIYIYLLKRYLVSSIQPTCEALEYFYQLMATIEEIRTLRRGMELDFDDYGPDGCYVIRNRVVRLIELESIQW